MHYSVLPPEINSALIFAGAGSGPMLAAASAWDGLATELASAAVSFGSVTAGLVGGSWQGRHRWRWQRRQPRMRGGWPRRAAATDGTTALLSYRPDTVQHDLESARSRLTGTFLDAYTQLTHDVVIPGAQQKQISAVATVAAAASVSTSADRAVVLLFVNQTITVGKDAPTTAASSVRVTLDNINGRWLISQFEPI